MRTHGAARWIVHGLFIVVTSLGIPAAARISSGARIDSDVRIELALAGKVEILDQWRGG